MLSGEWRGSGGCGCAAGGVGIRVRAPSAARPARLYTPGWVGVGCACSGRLRASLKRPCWAVPACGLDRRPRHDLCRHAMPAQAWLPTGGAVLGPSLKAVPGRLNAGCMKIYIPNTWRWSSTGSPPHQPQHKSSSGSPTGSSARPTAPPRWSRASWR